MVLQCQVVRKIWLKQARMLLSIQYKQMVMRWEFWLKKMIMVWILTPQPHFLDYYEYYITNKVYWIINDSIYKSDLICMCIITEKSLWILCFCKAWWFVEVGSRSQKQACIYYCDRKVKNLEEDLCVIGLWKGR